ncbi:hypothetical protein KPL74_06060 [Bacillus sp. NP157]|nr:hypothetical protein KPL74_06060 [Bacillus sp. NP157]
MAARSVRCLFSNQTSSFLSYVSDHHDHGQFTDPWYPPASIAPGGMAEWRSESDGFMTGTEGTVRYSTAVIEGSSGHTEFLDVHWDNPFIGGNSANATATLDFSNAPSSVLKVAWFIEANGETPPNLAKAEGGDVEASLDGFLFAPYFIANWNVRSYNDANAFFAVKESSPPQFVGDFPGPPTGAKTMQLNTDLKPAEWAGHWSSGAVSITLVSKSGKVMTAYITDNSTSPALQFQQDFSLGLPTWVADHMVASVIQSRTDGSGPLASVFTAAAKTTAMALQGKDAGPAHSLFEKAAESLAKTHDVAISKAGLASVSKSIGAYLAASKYTVALAQGVYLTLYDLFTGTQRTGQVMRYERHGVGGVIAYTVDLSYVISLH